MLLKKRRVFLKKRRARFAKSDVLAVLGAVGLVAFLSFMAFRGGDANDPGVALSGQDTVQTTPAATTPTTAGDGAQVEGVTLAYTGRNTTPFFIAGLSMVLLGTAMLRAGRRRTADAHRLATAAMLAG